MTAHQIAAVALAIGSRLAYVGYVGIVLKRQDRAAAADSAAAFRRFRRRAAILMNLDAACFILLCLVTSNTFDSPAAWPIIAASGLALVAIGLGVKVWAARTLGPDAYYWVNFFIPAASRAPVAAGPYRYVANPMYTIGYLQTYGLALVFHSWPGLVASAFAHLAILVMYFAVEKPHFERLHTS